MVEFYLKWSNFHLMSIFATYRLKEVDWDWIDPQRSRSGSRKNLNTRHHCSQQRPNDDDRKRNAAGAARPASMVPLVFFWPAVPQNGDGF